MNVPGLCNTRAADGLDDFFSVAAAVPFVVDYALHEACRWSLASSQIVPMERRGQTDRVG